MKQIVFYSWQSDLPNAANRGFIQSALESAASSIAADQSVAVEPVVDRDTQGVPGSPDISHTIFSKITASDTFVADVTIVARSDNRAMPNPNVLIELGYALKTLGHEKVILVFNKSFGNVEELPFDLRARRVLTYEMPAESPSRGPERKSLEKGLEAAIRNALPPVPTDQDPPAAPALVAIESQSANRLLALRRNLATILDAIQRDQPLIHSAGGTVEDLLSSIQKSQVSVAEFSKIVEVISTVADSDAAIEVIRRFGGILQLYEPAPGFSGSFSDADFDYFKFVGHEMFVTLVALLLRERRWSILEQVLEEPIPVRHLVRDGGPGILQWNEASDHLALLLAESRKRGRVSIHADVLKERHTTGGLAALLPFDEFIATDFLLYLLGEIRPSNRSNWGFAWRPWSSVYLKSTPIFLINAQRKRFAEPLQKLFQSDDIQELKKKLITASADVGKLFNHPFWTNPIRTDAIEAIGTM